MTERRRAGARGQANLPVVAVALVVLTAVTGTAVAMADGALVSAERDAAERAAAVSAADRLVAADASVTRRANVLDRAAVRDLDPATLDRVAPAVAGRDVRVRIGDETVVERGDPTGGTTISRIALLASDDAWTETLAAGGERITLPRRTDSLVVRVASGTVETVRVDGRVVLHDPEGIEGEAVVNVSRYRTLSVTAAGNGSVRLRASPETTEKATVEVTVGE